ncbi:MAG: hypothetical protein KGL39_05590 [Patescibacteria group bacterium]|nr:hypothetical protein [Patescibacteria group bacterium]
MAPILATYRQSEAHCSKGHRLSKVLVRDGESVKQTCRRCNEVIETTVRRDTLGHLLVSIERRLASAS